MTYEIWENDLRSRILSLPAEERERVLEYYREMYSEMTASGRSVESILEEFGTPEKCAAQVSAEWGSKAEDSENALPASAPEPKGKKRVSAAEVVGLIFATLLLILPIGVSAFAVVISFGAVCVSGGVVGVGGILLAIAYPFSGASAASIPAGIGLSLASAGAGLLLMVGFYYLTKWSAIWTILALKAIYKRR